MIKLTQAQRRTLEEMRGYIVMGRMKTGAVLIAHTGKNQSGLVIDTSGSVSSLGSFLAHLSSQQSSGAHVHPTVAAHNSENP